MAEPLLKKHWEHDSTITMDPLSIDPIQPGRFEQHRVLAIIGSGPVGVQCAQALLQRGFKGMIKLFGDEPWQPYNRMQLSSLVAGEVRYRDILFPEIENNKDRFLFLHRRVVSIDPAHHALIDDKGVRHHFHQLVFATGSRPWVPNVRGLGLPGVFVFRDLNDAQQLMARSARTRRTVIVGGGILGVEAARAMQRNNTQVTLVHQSDRLMNRQLDSEAGAILKRTLEGYGVEVFLNSGMRKILGTTGVTGVELRNGRSIECDTVIFATGIQPNVELARAGGLKVGRGIVVDDTLQTSREDVFAIGECAEHRGQIYGLLAPGLEQCGIRPAVSEKRLALTSQGKVRYELKTPYRDGTTHVFFEPLDFIARLAALVPKPRVNLTRFHGLFAPNNKHRALVTPGKRGKGRKPTEVECTQEKTIEERRNAMTWMQRLKRVFNIDIEQCEHCGGHVKVVACIEDPAVIEKILQHLALKESPSLARVNDARGPPDQSVLFQC